MLIEFSVANFRSIKERQTLSMVSAGSKELRETNTMPILNGKQSLVRSAVIYGANASGKTNLLHALHIMREVVLKSAQSQRGQGIPITPYLFDSTTNNAPTEFEVMFISDGVRYQYGFVATSSRIIEEWLFAYPKGRAQNWIERIYDEKLNEYEWKHSEKLTGPKNLWQEATRDNALFLSTAIQLNNIQLQPVFDWFRVMNIIGINEIPMMFTFNYSSVPENKQKVVEYLQSADFSIFDLNIQRRKLSREDWPEDIQVDIKDDVQFSLEQIESNTIHLGQDGLRYELDLGEESDGTQRFFAFLGPWLDILRKGHILCVDELNAHLHPLLVKHLVQMFHDSEKNPKNAQLIFTTHETSILNQEIFRRDQIWFTEKDEYNATTLYPLTDFKPRKKVENLEKGYLQGRYGALPYLREINSVVDNEDG